MEAPNLTVIDEFTKGNCRTLSEGLRTQSKISVPLCLLR
jgi:hypothetical protein